MAAEAGEADTVVRAGKAAVAATVALLVTVATAAAPAAVLGVAKACLVQCHSPKLSEEHLAAVERVEALWEASEPVVRARAARAARAAARAIVE